MPAECALDTDELLSYSHKAPYDLREWRAPNVTPLKRSCRDLWSVQQLAPPSVGNAHKLGGRGRDLIERRDIALRAEIEHARGMIGNVEDEDVEVPVFSEQSLNRAIAFLRAQSAQFRKMFGTFAPVPNIGPGPSGSVDLHWRREGWELLVNIPSGGSRLATFYGDDYGAQKIKGGFDPTTFNYGVIMWLMNS